MSQLDTLSVPTWSLEPTYSGEGFVFLDKSLNFLVDPTFLVGGPFAYLLMNYMLTSYMKDRKAYDLSGLMKVYNVVQILVCAYMSIGITLHMYMTMPIFQSVNLFGLDLTFFNMFGINTKYNAGLEWFVLVHYLSKYLDFFDTIFIILRKKDAQHSFLHVFHHATIGSVWGFLLHLGHGNGTAAYGAFINSIVHVVMYTHYLVSSYGIQHPFKKYITQFQIVQFFSCEAHALLVIGGLETVYPTWLGWLQITYHITMITLFMDFYIKQNRGRSQARKESASKKIE